MPNGGASAGLTYVVLDDELQRADPPRFGQLLDGFVAGYRSTFSGDEAEPPGDWRERIAGLPAPQPRMRVAVAVDADGEVLGGAAAEYYRASACVLVTYLYILERPGQRRRGHARALLSAVLQACRRLGPVQATLAEAEWPELLPSQRFSADDVAIARDRLRFFERLGACRVAIDYVQPALGPGLKPVPWLRLFVLPSAPAVAADESSLRIALDRFLQEFHEALAQSGAAAIDAALLSQQRAQVAAARPLCVELR
jgi:GNAT superfamily N-acetyltransferase